MLTQRSQRVALAIVVIWVAVMLTGFSFSATPVGFSTAPPMQLLESNDHAQIAAWYEQHAIELRQHAEAMRKMAKLYTKRGTGMVRHCKTLVELYTKAAEENEALAKSHTEMAKGS